MGAFGILFATAISRVLTNAWYDPYAVFKYGFQEKSGVYFKRYFIYALILMGTGGICFGICSFIHINIWMNVVIKFLICCIIPNMIFTICFYQLLEFQYLLGFAKRLKSKAVQKIKR